LVKKGFVEDSTHHVMFWLHVNGKKTRVHTRYSHGVTECNDFLLSLMASQLHLSNREFNDLIDCPLKKENYIQILRDKGAIDE
jgi:hypothetical protein